MASTALNDDEIKEYYDSDEKLQDDATKLAELIKSSKHCVIYTGAGISTAAGIADFRGPNGVWTLRSKGVKSVIKRHVKMPTKTHMAIKELLDRNLAKFLVSQNIDGLHLKSGVPLAKISEVHGNTNKEYCSKCKKIFYRDYSTRTAKSDHDHKTGRKCACGGEFYDSIINFNESLPEAELDSAVKNSVMCDLAIVLGTSMRVKPACDFPVYNKESKLVICNLQKTPYDERAQLVIHSSTDKLMQSLFEKLSLVIPDYIYRFNFKVAIDKSMRKMKFTEASTDLKKLLNAVRVTDTRNRKFQLEITTLSAKLDNYKDDDEYTLDIELNLLNPVSNSFKIKKSCVVEGTVNTSTQVLDFETK